jgi:hypothetical protein
MKTSQTLMLIILIIILFNCIKREDVEPKYKEISGKWKLESAELNEKPYVNDSLIKYNLLDIPYHKFSNKKRTDERVKFGFFIVNENTINLDYQFKIDKFYKIRNNSDIEFQYNDSNYGFSQNFGNEGVLANHNELTDKIFSGMWRYEVTFKNLTLIRNKILTDSLGGLKLIYKKM